MKQLFTFLLLVIVTGINAQAPQSIPYQAVVRNTDGSVMADAAMTITFKIHDASATGNLVYEETHAATTNSQGLISLNVGNGVVVSGTFSGINWGSGNKFLHVLMNAGSGVVDLGTQQMMSVPYALYAHKAGSINLTVSLTGDTLFQGNGDFIIVPGISLANSNNQSNIITNDSLIEGDLGVVLLPGILTCQDEYISVTGCGGQESLLYNDIQYSLIEINGQCWFAENLSTSKYRTGANIISGLSGPAWAAINEGAYSFYNNDQNNGYVNGNLYNYFAVTDSRGLCPTGWHRPSDCEWMYLEMSINMPLMDLENFGYRGINQGALLKANSSWIYESGLNNNLGFNARPAGYREYQGSFSGLNTNAIFWTSTGNIVRVLVSQNSQLNRDGQPSNAGSSIRCIKD